MYNSVYRSPGAVSYRKALDLGVCRRDAPHEAPRPAGPRPPRDPHPTALRLEGGKERRRVISAERQRKGVGGYPALSHLEESGVRVIGVPAFA